METQNPAMKRAHLISNLQLNAATIGYSTRLTERKFKSLLEISDPSELGRYTFTISLESLNVAIIQVTYLELKYGKSTISKRNAIKSAKDIFEFCHEMQTIDRSRMSAPLMDERLERLNLSYRNSFSTRSVVVETVKRVDVIDLIFRMDEVLRGCVSQLNHLSRLISIDLENGGKALRWDAPAEVGKDWWKH